MKKSAVQFIRKKLESGISLMLLYVVYSEGSSPGRAGFHMIVAEDQELWGSIGGGIMEHKLVELSRKKLQEKEEQTELKYQYHDKAHKTQQSGMICSGYQVIAFIPLYSKDQALILQLEKAILTNKQAYLVLHKNGMSISEKKDIDMPGFYDKENNEWNYSEKLNSQKVLHIFGAGHVSLALSEVMNFLGFYVKIYDDRPDINTLKQNEFSHEKHVLSYDTLGDSLTTSEDDYVVIMTFGYRPDKIVLKQLLEKQFFYIGMMGSKAKIKKLLEELREEGYSPESYQHVFTPIGIEIFSKTPQEIAISIAAEIIRETNKKFSA